MGILGGFHKCFRGVLRRHSERSLVTIVNSITHTQGSLRVISWILGLYIEAPAHEFLTMYLV